MSESIPPGGNPSVQPDAAADQFKVVAGQINAIRDTLDSFDKRIKALETAVDELDSEAADRAKDEHPHTGAVVMQDIVDFLHHIFPGETAGRVPPGTPSHLTEGGG